MCHSERSEAESKNLPIYGLLMRNSRAKILRRASLAQDDRFFGLPPPLRGTPLINAGGKGGEWTVCEIAQKWGDKWLGLTRNFMQFIHRDFVQFGGKNVIFCLYFCLECDKIELNITGTV